jgi:hypothetical protein
MQRWQSKTPLETPIDFSTLTQFDLVFEELRQDKGSYTAYVFMAERKGSRRTRIPDDAGRDHPLFATGFSIFGSEECWGGEGHCDWRQGPVSPFDMRPPHHLMPVNFVLDVTDAVRALGNPNAIDVTVLATGENPADTDVLEFTRLTGLAYQGVRDEADVQAHP